LLDLLVERLIVEETIEGEAFRALVVQHETSNRPVAPAAAATPGSA
jgi:hypothetical protein